MDILLFKLLGFLEDITFFTDLYTPLTLRISTHPRTRSFTPRQATLTNYPPGQEIF